MKPLDLTGKLAIGVFRFLPVHIVRIKIDFGRFPGGTDESVDLRQELSSGQDLLQAGEMDCLLRPQKDPIPLFIIVIYRWEIEQLCELAALFGKDKHQILLPES